MHLEYGKKLCGMGFGLLVNDFTEFTTADPSFDDFSSLPMAEIRTNESSWIVSPFFRSKDPRLSGFRCRIPSSIADIHLLFHSILILK